MYRIILCLCLAILMLAPAGCRSTRTGELNPKDKPPPLDPTLIVFVVDDQGHVVIGDILAMSINKRMEERCGGEKAIDRFEYRLTPKPASIQGHWTAGL